MKRVLGCIAIGLLHYPAWVVNTIPLSVRISDAMDDAYCPICHIQSLWADRKEIV